MPLWARIKQSLSNVKNRLLPGTSRADFIAGRTNQAHYTDRWGREWFLYRDPTHPMETAYRVEKNGKVIKEGHTPNIGALDETGQPVKPQPYEAGPPVAPKKPIKELVKEMGEQRGRLREQQTGTQLLIKLVAFGQKFSIDYKALQKVKKMNPNALLEMYSKSQILFEAYWDYKTLEHGPYGLYAGDTKNAEVWEFVNEYERLYGVL